MAITKQQPGAAKAATAAGTVIGTAAREKEDRARVEREQARADAEAMQRQARQDEIKFALHKRQVDWERSLQKEQRQEDYKLATEDRAMERGLAAADYTAQKALERIEFSKDLDHQYKTQERQRKLGAVDADEAALDNDIEKGNSNEDEFAVKMAQLKIDNRRIAIETGLPLERVTDADRMALMVSGDKGGTAGPGGEPKTFTDIGGFPLPIPTIETLTAQHVHAAKQDGIAFIIDKHTNELKQMPIANVDEVLALARYEAPKITGAPITKTQELHRVGPDIVRQETTRPQRGSFFF